VALTQNYWNYSGPQHQYAPEDLVSYNQHNYATGGTLSGGVPSFEAWMRQEGSNNSYGDNDPHDAYSQAIATSLMAPDQFLENQNRNRPQSGGVLDYVAQGIITAAAGGIPVSSLADAAMGPPQAPGPYNMPHTGGGSDENGLLNFLMSGSSVNQSGGLYGGGQQSYLGGRGLI
jgi:hypothetical protein